MHYNPTIDWYTLNRRVWEERMEQVRELDGEKAYEKMRRAVERASQPLTLSQFPSHDGPERRGPERDFGPAASSSLPVVGLCLCGSKQSRTFSNSCFETVLESCGKLLGRFSNQWCCIVECRSEASACRPSGKSISPVSQGQGQTRPRSRHRLGGR